MKVDQAVGVFRVFSDRTRLRIFLLLLDAELCVREMMALLKTEQSLLSHQLQIMRQAGLVEFRRNGRWIYYRILPACRKQLEPVFREWFREELAATGPKVRGVKGKQVCLTSGDEACQPEPVSPLKRGAGLKRRGSKGI